ncbi:hypothetical protein PHMEG_00010012 [Phytophthora megakarya]|uniref:Uncharacterized protein n=1 Tax=Phytophthora megakarya TaxID=4795 RepID=A0A225WES4_9STRA|nr:hypothetical protein PHMEG_00010012 [Phytophthora megakarya]
MEGVVMVEMSSGTLHYTKSFSDAFDARHPKSERLNLGALVFALQNFAGSSIRRTDTNDTDSTPLTTGVVDIGMFSTPQENMVLAITPSNSLLVVLFTTPDFDAGVAKWVVRRVAFNYEGIDDTQMQQTPTLNQVPRRFRQALSKAIDKTIERELIGLSEIVLIPPRENNDRAENSASEELFLFFSFSPHMIISYSGNENKTDKAANATRHNAHEEEHRTAARATNSTVSEISRNAPRLSLYTMLAFVRISVTTPFKNKSYEEKKLMKKTRWKSRNTVVHHSAPHNFQRVIEIRCHDKKMVVLEPHQTEKAYNIAGVLIPFVELVTFPNDKMIQLRSQNLNQLVWKNIPSASPSNGAGTNIIAWYSGPCCIFYPVTTMCMNPEIKFRVHRAVAALFDVLEPLLHAKTKILV